jgi:hypothetical protein
MQIAFPTPGVLVSVKSQPTLFGGARSPPLPDPLPQRRDPIVRGWGHGR